MTRDTSTMCPQWPDRCCLCMTKKDGVVLTGLVSMLFDLAFIILCTYTTYEPEIWNLSYKSIQDWVITTRWDSEIIHIALKAMSYINEYKIFVIYVLITNSVIHAMCGLNLIIGGCLSPTSKQRLLFLPWLTLDMIYIVLTTVLFVCWAFLSFFVHILVAIFFTRYQRSLFGLLDIRLAQCARTFYYLWPT